MAEPTPMIRQYLEVKSKYPDSILFYRLGDFYEMFFEDAETSSRLLGLTLTARNKNSEDKVPMCGVPYHSATSYINKLVAHGHKVAVCEQVEDPKTVKGIVKREVVQVITPAINLDPDALSEKNHQYLLAIVSHQDKFGLACSDISTGDFRMTELEGEEELFGEVYRLEPREILFLSENEKSDWLLKIRKIFDQVHFFQVPVSEGTAESSFDLAFVESFKNRPLALQAGRLITDYVHSNRLMKDRLLQQPVYYSLSSSMLLDANAKRNLELTETTERNVKGSLFWLLDQAKTPMGSRLLKRWVQYPLIDVSEINSRLDAVEELKLNSQFLSSLREEMKPILDLERIQNRIVANQTNARDLVALKNSLTTIPQIKHLLSGSSSLVLREAGEKLDALDDITCEIERQIIDEPPFSVREGGMIKEGASVEVDELRNLESNAKAILAQMETQERERTGISSLKIRYNNIFGYSIEITHTHKDKIPSDYIRKQTLSNAERFITPELKEYEQKILGAREKLCELEYQQFCMLREKIVEASYRIKLTASFVAKLDVLCSLALVAQEYGYVRPEVSTDTILEIKTGRHPLVENLFREEAFVPNDIQLNTTDNRLILITGPNMAGKSTVMRQTALIVLMAQMGSFVPAEDAKVGIVDRIFTRIGASDFLQKGQSTFMVEMIETAQILSQATQKSLIILDEIGRGTSTFDGLSIAWAVAETIHDQIKARTLFATHYHELTDLAQEKEGIKNFQMMVKEWNGKIIFLRELKQGAANRSYGVQVASMAGLPGSTIKRAKEILGLLESKDLQFLNAATGHKSQLSLFVPEVKNEKFEQIAQELTDLDINQLTPMNALNYLNDLKNRVKN